MNMDKRRRNARPSKYRPRTEAQKQRRQQLWDARAEARKHRQTGDDEARWLARLAELETALRDHGHNGIHGRRHTRPLDTITDDAERFGVLKARVERLEALWSIDRRKRETRGKIIIGGALLAELIDAAITADRTLLTTVLDILDRRVDLARDRLTVRDLLGDAPLPLRRGGEVAEDLSTALQSMADDTPDFDALVQEAMAEDDDFRPSDIHEDYADLDPVWRNEAYGSPALTRPSRDTNSARDGSPEGATADAAGGPSG
jgi:hypothetical protein